MSRDVRVVLPIHIGREAGLRLESSKRDGAESATRSEPIGAKPAPLMRRPFDRPRADAPRAPACSSQHPLATATDSATPPRYVVREAPALALVSRSCVRSDPRCLGYPMPGLPHRHE